MWLARFTSSICLDEIEVVHGDIRDFSCVRSAVLGCDSVFHLASLIAIPYSYKVLKVILIPTYLERFNILQSCLELGIRRLVHTSTSDLMVQPNSFLSPKTPLAAQSPYAASKIAADQLFKFFSQF